MANKKDYYETLGVSKTSTEQEIKAAYRSLAKKYHPDVNKDHGSEAKFKEVQEAYDVLSNPSKKQQYDQFGHDTYNQNGGGPSSGFGGSAGFDFNNFDFGDVFGDLFGSAFGGGNRSRRGQKGQDAIIRMNLTFEEAAFGTKKNINIDVTTQCHECHGHGGQGEKTCSRCHGSGQITQEQRTILGVYMTRTTCPTCEGQGVTYEHECHKCHGRGIVKENKDITVTIPSGVDTGNQLRLQGKGEAGQNGGPNGDIYIEFMVKSHEIYKRDGNDIYLDMPLTIPEAVLGVKKDIPTLYGKVKLTIPEGSQSGDKHRLKGKGIEDVNSKRKGDMYVVIDIVIPKILSKDQKDLFNKLATTTLDRDNKIERFKKHV